MKIKMYDCNDDFIMNEYKTENIENRNIDNRYEYDNRYENYPRKRAYERIIMLEDLENIIKIKKIFLKKNSKDFIKLPVSLGLKIFVVFTLFFSSVTFLVDAKADGIEFVIDFIKQISLLMLCISTVITLLGLMISGVSFLFLKKKINSDRLKCYYAKSLEVFEKKVKEKNSSKISYVYEISLGLDTLLRKEFSHNYTFLIDQKTYNAIKNSKNKDVIVLFDSWEYHIYSVNEILDN